MPTIECTQACTVAVTLSMSVPTQEEFADFGIAFGLLMLVTVPIYAGRQILNLLRSDNES